MSRRNVALAMLVGLGALVTGAAAGATGVSASADDDKITLTVGVIQDIDTPNVTAGFLVSSYELWNLQYATLTDKAAADFATDIGEERVGPAGRGVARMLRQRPLVDYAVAWLDQNRAA